MKATGEDVAESIREWLHDEIRRGPACIYDLGKFFFTVSSSSLGVEITIEKLGSTPQISSTLVCSILMLFASILIALRMAVPKMYSLDGSIDLYDLYSKHLKRMGRFSIAWFSLWAIGVAAWLWQIF